MLEFLIDENFSKRYFILYFYKYIYFDIEIILKNDLLDKWVISDDRVGSLVDKLCL